jgi:hypothetical protein
VQRLSLGGVPFDHRLSLPLMLSLEFLRSVAGRRLLRHGAGRTKQY